MMKDSGIQGCSVPGPRAQSERKMLAFQLNTFFLLHFFSLAFFGVGFSIIRASNFFFFFFYERLHRSLGASAPRGRRVDGWSSEEEEGKRMGRELNVYVGVCVCVCVNCGDAVWPWACSFSYCHSNVPPNRSPVSVWTQWLLKAFKKLNKNIINFWWNSNAISSYSWCLVYVILQWHRIGENIF